MNYGQFCPIAKASEMLGERWTILIIRELIAGGHRFNELQRGLGSISPALLAARLKSLEAEGLVARRRIPGQRTYEYHPTEACSALLPVLIAMGEWGLLWARHTVTPADIDVELLMLYLERSVDPAKLVGNQSVIRFHFKDLPAQRDWWLVVKDRKVDLCLVDPGHDVDVYFFCTVRTMHDIWMGDLSYGEAVTSGALIVEGEPALTRNIRSWLNPSVFAGSPRAALRM